MKTDFAHRNRIRNSVCNNDMFMQYDNFKFDISNIYLKPKLGFFHIQTLLIFLHLFSNMTFHLLLSNKTNIYTSLL
uniref:Uncharacterized protein n=1 Tax=Anguilla anguilla TaxID=7936 RepID=A0A0E9SQ46_ANGAN